VSRRRCLAAFLIVLTGSLLGLNLRTVASVHAAATSAGEESAARIPDIVVTPTRRAEPLTESAAAATVLSADQIERTPYRHGHQVDDLLRYVPDVQPSTLSSRFNHPTAQAVTVRGLGNRRALVLLDGVPLNDGFGGWINWSLAPDTIARVEVVPGGTSNLYGTWAMGGVVHLFTEPKRAGVGLRSDSEAGTLNSYTQSLVGRLGNERASLTVNYRWFHTNGFIPVPSYQQGPIDRTDDSRHENVHAKALLELTPNTALSLTGSLFREDRTFGTPLSLAGRTIGNAAIALDGATAGGDEWQVKTFFQTQTFRNLSTQVVPSPTVRLGEFQDRIQVIPSHDMGGQAHWTGRVAKDHRLLLGADVRAILGQSEEQVFARTGPLGRTLAEGKQVGFGLYGEWIASVTDRLTVTPSLRMDWWKNFDAQIVSIQGVAQAPRDNVENVLNPKLAAQYRFTDRLRVGASLYQAFRAPTLNELYRGFGFAGFSFLPNASLAPERLTGGDAKLEGELFPDRRLSWRLSGHYDVVKDQIQFVTQGPLTAQRQNVGRSRAVGGTVDLRLRLTDLVSAQAGYTFVDSVITEFPGRADLIGKRVPNVSRRQAVMGLTLGRPDSVEVTLMGRYLSRQFADDLNAQPVADFFVLDASAQRNLGKAARLFLNAENLTDRQYIATQTGPIKTIGLPLLVMGGIKIEY
jgi:outer membrane receptor protein involved in Fe transport